MSAPIILALMTTCFLCFGYLGVPVPFALLGGVFVGALLADVSFAAIIQKVFDGVDNEALLAIPFFLLVGELMSSANVVVRIANLSMALVGHMRGGLSQVVTVFSMFFSEMSGSTTADVAVMSRALAGPMKKEGYEGPFIAAIIAAASTIAALVPPSITAVVYGATGNVSIAGLFMAGFMPGLMIGFGLMIYCYFFGPVGFKRPRASFGMIALATRDAALPLMIPVILLGGILTGWFTPTEAGVVAAVWIIVVVIPALNPRHIWNLPYDFCLAGLIFSLPLITIGAANAFGYLLAYLRGAIVISDWIIGIAGTDPHLIMLLMVLLFTIVGDFIEPVPTIIIFMPLVNALTTAGHINPVHMGVVLIATLAFGLITPPYGLVLLMASKFVGVRFSQALRAALPIYVVFFATIAFCIYFPEVVLWLPKQVLPASVGCFQNPRRNRADLPTGVTVPIDSDVKPRLKAPAGLCDTHMHVYDGSYPTAPTAKFVPPDAPVSAYQKMCRRLGIERTVVVQPSTYGKDNRCTLKAVADIGPNARCIVVVDESVDRRGTGPADKARRSRHPLFHAAGSSPALGNSRNDVGAGSAVRLARATAARWPQPSGTREPASSG